MLTVTVDEAVSNGFLAKFDLSLCLEVHFFEHFEAPPQINIAMSCPLAFAYSLRSNPNLSNQQLNYCQSSKVWQRASIVSSVSTHWLWRDVGVYYPSAVCGEFKYSW